MENDFEKQFAKIVNCIEALGKTVKYTCECVTLLTEEVVSLRKDVDKLIENNQKGASK